MKSPPLGYIQVTKAMGHNATIFMVFSVTYYLDLRCAITFDYSSYFSLVVWILYSINILLDKKLH